MPTVSHPEVVAKREIQKAENSRYDLIGKGLNYREGSEIGLLRLDLDGKFVEIYNITENIEKLGNRLGKLDNWTYEIGRIYTHMDSPKPLEGDLYYRNEDAWKFELDKYRFKELSEAIFGKNIMQMHGYNLVSDEYTRIETRS